MRKRWLGLLVLATWAATALCAICGWWDACWRLTELWMVLVPLWVLRGLWRLLRVLFGSRDSVGAR
jgi:hypothetical protein